jgi:hypothetical protein
MRETDINKKVFHRGHWMILAKQLREAFPTYTPDRDEDEEMWNHVMTSRSTLIGLELSLATRFLADNEDFDPVLFMNNCSPNIEEFPLGEVWEDYKKNGVDTNIPDETWEHDG